MESNFVLIKAPPSFHFLSRGSHHMHFANWEHTTDGDVGTGGSGAASSQSDNGGGGINKLDLMSLLKEQQEGTAIATKQLLSEYTEQSIERNTSLLATFGEGIQEQLGQFNNRVENVEHEAVELKSDVTKMQALIAEVQQEQQRQRDVFQLANHQGGISQADLDADNFFRPPNLEIVQISSPKFVSLASVENAFKPHMETQHISADVWRLGGNP